MCFGLTGPTLSVKVILAPWSRRSCRAGRLPPLQAQWTAVASSWNTHWAVKLTLWVYQRMTVWIKSHSSHLVFFVNSSSGLQESFHDLHVSFERGFVQSGSLELDMIWKESFLTAGEQLKYGYNGFITS